MRYKHLRVRRDVEGIGAHLGEVSLPQLAQDGVQQELRRALQEFKCLFLSPQAACPDAQLDAIARIFGLAASAARGVEDDARGGGVTQAIEPSCGDSVPCWVDVARVCDALPPGLHAWIAAARASSLSATETRAMLQVVEAWMQRHEFQVRHKWVAHEIAIWESPSVLWCHRGKADSFRHAHFTLPPGAAGEADGTTNLASLLAMP